MRLIADRLSIGDLLIRIPNLYGKIRSYPILNGVGKHDSRGELRAILLDDLIQLLAGPYGGLSRFVQFDHKRTLPD